MGKLGFFSESPVSLQNKNIFLFFLLFLRVTVAVFLDFTTLPVVLVVHSSTSVKMAVDVM